MSREQSSKPNSPELAVLMSINRKLDEVIKLLAVVAVSNKDETIQMKALKAHGLSSEEIGTFLGKGGSAVRMALKKAKKAKSRKGVSNDQ
jgi:hypothetical protein